MKNLISNLTHNILTWVFKIHSYFGLKLLGIKTNDVTLGDGYKRHEIASDGDKRLYVTEERRILIRGIMAKIEKFNEATPNDVSPNMNSFKNITDQIESSKLPNIIKEAMTGNINVKPKKKPFETNRREGSDMTPFERERYQKLVLDKEFGRDNHKLIIQEKQLKTIKNN